MYIGCDHNNTLLAGCIHSMHIWIYDSIFVIAAGPLERIYLSAPIVAIRGKEANLTAVVWPIHTRTLTFFWWFDNSSEVRRVSFSFSYAQHSSAHAHSIYPFYILHCHLQSKSINLRRLPHKSCKKGQHVTTRGHSRGSSCLIIFTYHTHCVQCSMPTLYSVYTVHSVLYSAKTMHDSVHFSVFFLLKSSPL